MTSINKRLIIGLAALAAISITGGSSIWFVEAQPSGIQPAPAPFGTPQQLLQVSSENDGPDIVLLSSRFNEQSSSDGIVGEVMNNGTDSAEYVQALATFRDSSGAVIDTASGYADPHLVIAKDSAPFKILLTPEVIEDNAAAYDLTLKWRDLDFGEFSKDVLNGQTLSGSDNDDDDDGNSGSNDDDNNNDGYGCEPNLECQLEGNREWAKDHIGNFDEMSEEDQESAISDVLNDVDEDYLDAQQEKENQGDDIEGKEDSNDGGGNDKPNEDQGTED